MNPADVVYESLAGVPGRYFRCTRYGLMNVGACARNFAAAPALCSEARLSACIGCPTGLLHADGPTAAAASPYASPCALPYASPYASICTRCRRDPADASKYRSTRQGRIRMVRDGMICVSCFNREREVLRGQNARGTKPRVLVLREVSVACIVDQRVSVARLAVAKDAVEGALTVIRKSGGTALVAWIGMGVQPIKQNEQKQWEQKQ